MLKSLNKEQFYYDPQYKYIAKKGEKFKRYMNPFLYLKKNFDVIENDVVKKELINQFQVTLHTLLDSYLNSLFLPIIPLNSKRTSKFTKKLGNLLWCLEKLNELEGHNEISRVIFQYGNCLSRNFISRRKIAYLISISYGLLDKLIEENEFGCKAKKVKFGKIFSKIAYKSHSEKPIIEFWEYANEKLKEYLLDILLHGSYSSLDHCKYSDLDTLLIIKKEIIDNDYKLYTFQKTVRKSLKYLYLVDPLQHHGHFVLTEYDLNYFPETFFPLSIFDNSTSFWQKSTYEFNIFLRNSNIEALNQIWQLCYSFRESYFKRDFPRTIYELKLYLSKIMLLPALYQQAKGESCYKRESFERANSDFLAIEWDAVEQATELRGNWRLPSYVKWVFKKPILFGLDPQATSILAEIVLKKLPNKIEKYVQTLLFEKATIFSEAIIKRLPEYLND